MYSTFKIEDSIKDGCGAQFMSSMHVTSHVGSCWFFRKGSHARPGSTCPCYVTKTNLTQLNVVCCDVSCSASSSTVQHFVLLLFFLVAICALLFIVLDRVLLYIGPILPNVIFRFYLYNGHFRAGNSRTLYLLLKYKAR